MRCERLRDERGSALLWALVTLFALIAMATAMTTLMTKVDLETRVEEDAVGGFYSADGATQALRTFLVQDFRTQYSLGSSPAQWVADIESWAGIAPQQHGGGSTARFIGAGFADPQGYILSLNAYPDTAVRVTAISTPGDPVWIEVTADSPMNVDPATGAAVEMRRRGRETVIQRLSFGPSMGAGGGGEGVLNFAILCDTVNCMFCHLKVDGDVGTLRFFRPGWGTEGSNGQGSGADSLIYGHVYAALDITNDQTDLTARDDTADLERNPQYINGALLYPNGRDGDDVTTLANENYRGDELPADVTGDGVPDFPFVDPPAVKKFADGSIRGGIIKVVDPGGTFRTDARTLLEIVSTPESGGSPASSYEGNVILEGTKDNPLVLDGDIYIGGDVIIKGYVTGRAAIYSSRNVYFSGNVVYVNEPLPYSPGTGQDPMAKAEQSVENGSDELRFAAKGNIVIGDYTNLDHADAVNPPATWAMGADGQIAGSSTLPVSLRQSEDYYRAQFAPLINTQLSLAGGVIAFSKATGEELTYNDSTNAWQDDAGQDVAPADYHTMSNADTIYSAIFKPSAVNGDDNLTQWISDVEYRQLMGSHSDLSTGSEKKGLRDNTWRGRFSGSRAQVKQQLLDNGFSDAKAETILNTGTGWENNTSSYISGDNSGGNRNFTLRQVNDESFLGGNADGQALYNNWLTELGGDPSDFSYSGGTSRVPSLMQIERIDAYLYANKRVAGKTSGTNLAIYGGAVAREVGILAPGRRKEWWMRSNSKFGYINSNANNSVNGEKYGVMAINYDYRLQVSGGKGLDLLSGIDFGRLLTWRRQR